MAFLIPVIILAALYYVRDIFPFGSNCYLRSDMYHQYAPVCSELWNKLRHGESLTYSWDIGMGTNFTALYAYYLASPSNWFIVLFPQKYMIEIMNSIIILKQCLSSIKGRFILSYNDSEFIRELYRDFEICSVERPNNLSRGIYKELIIKNY